MQKDRWQRPVWCLPLLLTGCATPLLDYRPDLPATAQLPVEAAGIVDARASFARRFEAALAHDPEHASSRASAWLHGVDDAPGTPIMAMTGPSADLRSWAVLVVPGLFGDCLGAYSVPFGDGRDHPADSLGRDAYAALADLGLGKLERVPLPGRASAPAIGARLASVLEAVAAEASIDHLLLIGYSKGVADSLEAIQQLDPAGAAWHKLRGLVSVAGTVTGTPLADHFAKTYARWGSAVDLLDCSPSEGGEIASISRAERLPRLLQQRWPDTLRRYSITAHAPVTALSRGLRPSGRLLARVDPRNDGQMIAADAILPGSVLLAEAATDHWGVALPPYAAEHALVRVFGPRADFPRQALLRAIILEAAAQPASAAPP